MLWIDLSGGIDGMTALQGAVEKSLALLGFPPERRAYTPHLTVGRIRNLRNPSELESAVASASGREWGGFEVERVHLMRSELFPTGPSYSILHEVRLNPF